MQCDRYREQLELMANTSHGEVDFAEVRQHLKECTECQQGFDQTEKLGSLIQRLMNSLPPPPYLATQILKQIEVNARKLVTKGGLPHISSTHNGSKKYLDI